MSENNHKSTRTVGWKELSVAVLSVVLTLCALEIALRVLEPPTTARYQSKEILDTGEVVPTTIPGTEGILLGRKATINREGYRGPVRTRQKPAGIIRILVFGDSHTFGTGAGDGATYPDQLESLLNRDGSGRFEVINFGVGGYDLRQSIRLARAKAPVYRPDLVLITYHAGDISSSDIFVDGRGKSAIQAFGSPLMKLNHYLRSHFAVYQFISPYLNAFMIRIGVTTAKGIHLKEYEEIASNGPLWSSLTADLLELRGQMAVQSTKLGVVLFPHMLNFNRHPAIDVHAAIGNWCARNGILYVDLLPYYKGHRPSALHASLLDNHANEKGYEIAAKGAYDLVRRMIGK